MDGSLLTPFLVERYTCVSENPCAFPKCFPLVQGWLKNSLIQIIHSVFQIRLVVLLPLAQHRLPWVLYQRSLPMRIIGLACGFISLIFFRCSDVRFSGDSYTQTGFDPTSTLPSPGNVLGNPPYPGFTATGGENWVDYVTTQYNKSLILTYNYAYGGATIDASLVVPFEPTVLSLTDQVNQFLSGAGTKPASTPWTSSDSLFSVFIGINDIGNSYYLSGDRDAWAGILVPRCWLTPPSPPTDSPMSCWTPTLLSYKNYSKAYSSVFFSHLSLSYHTLLAMPVAAISSLWTFLPSIEPHWYDIDVWNFRWWRSWPLFFFS